MKPVNQAFNTTTLDKIRNGFGFLTTDFDFRLLAAQQVGHFRADYFLIYRNDHAGIRLEICADETWFHCEIRRLINGIPAGYTDKTNCLGFEDLAIWESGNNYDHFDYYAGGKTGLDGVIENTAKLFKRNRELLTTDAWLDTNEIQHLKDKAFEQKFGKVPDRNRPGFFESLKIELNKLIAGTGYTVVLDSDQVGPFDQNSITDRLVIEKAASKIEISQVDWRDEYFIYQVIKNNQKILEMDLTKTDLDSAVALTINKMKSIL